MCDLFEKNEKKIEELSKEILNIILDGGCFVDKDTMCSLFIKTDELQTRVCYYYNHFND